MKLESQHVFTFLTGYGGGYGGYGGYDNGYKSYDRVAKELGENLTDKELQVLFSTLIFLEFRLISV